MTTIAHSFHWARNPDGTRSGEYPLGDKPPVAATLSVSGCAAGLVAAGIGSIQEGTPFSHNVRQYFSGTEAATCAITLELIAGPEPTTAGWTAPGSGNNLVFDGTTPNTGTFYVVGTGTGAPVRSATITWTCEATVPAGTVHTIAAGTAPVTFDCATEAVVPGDHIVFAPGTHGPRVIVNPRGSAALPITIRTAASGVGNLVTFTRALGTTGGFYVTIIGPQYVVFDGDYYDEGAYRMLWSGDDYASSYLKFDAGPASAVARNVIVRNIELDGNWNGSNIAATVKAVIGVQINDSATELTGGSSLYEGKFWDTFEFDNIYAHDIWGEAMYLGPNFSYQNAPSTDQRRMPLRNITVQNSLFDHIGREGVQGKCWFEGINLIDNCDFNDCGARGGASQDSSCSILWGRATLRNCRVNGATVDGTTAHGFQFWNGSNFSSASIADLGYGPYASFPVEIDNCVATNAYHGISVSTTGAFTGQIAFEPHIYNCTTVSNRGVGIITGATTGDDWVRNNISLDNTGGQISGSAENTSGRNLVAGSLASVFVDGANATVASRDFHLVAARAKYPGSVLGTDVANTDFDGDTRTLADADMGAYEYP